MKKVLRVCACIGFFIVCARLGYAEENTKDNAKNGFALNAAQALIYETDHLATLHKGDQLVYKAEFFDENDVVISEDQVVLKVIAEEGEVLRSVDIDFLSGENMLPFADFPSTRGNPIFMAILTRDVLQMRDATSGSDSYFRNRLRYAFAENPSVEKSVVQFNDKEYSASTILLKPYVEDKLIDRYPQFENKEYHFVIAEDVPGGIYSIRIINPEGKKEQYSLVDWKEGQ